MDHRIYEVTDRCRKNFDKYTIKAFSCIPAIDKPQILDMGCGTGVSALTLMDICNGDFYAVDTDESCLLWLKEKADAMGCSDRIKAVHASVFEKNLFDIKFDIVMAEGLLNMIGFDAGLPLLTRYLKKHGYLIIHDDIRNATRKQNVFKENSLELIDSFELNEHIWWKEYFHHLEELIEHRNKELFKEQIDQIKEIKKHPERFRSKCYILHKNIKD